MEDSENKEATETAEASHGEAEAKPARPVRMKWGRPIEEPEEEPAPSAEELPAEEPVPAEPKREEPPRPDPLVEALRRKLEKQEKRDNAACGGEGEPGPSAGSSPKNEPARKAPSPEELRAARAAAEANRLAAEREARRRAEENARMRYELEQENLRREVRKKRRREAVRQGFSAFFGGLLGLLRSIRISKKWVIAVSVTLVLSILTAVILGNLLRGRITPDDTGEESSGHIEPEETEPIFGNREVPSVNGGIVSLEGATARSLRSEASRFVSSGVTAVSLVLRDADGSLLFSAKTNGGLGLEGESETLLTIDEILSPFLAEGLYVSCLLPMEYFEEENPYARAVLYAYETALLCEVAEAGADEVVMLDACGMLIADPEEAEGGEEGSEALVRELIQIAASIRKGASEAAVGIALSPEFLASRVCDRYMGELAGAFDLALLDLRSCEDADGDGYAAVSAAVAEHLYFVLRYGMRVLIPAGCAEAVTEQEIYNWQEGTLPPSEPEETAAG